MKTRLLVIILSILAAGIFMSGGYGLWEKTMIIKGTIEVARPDTSNSQPPQEGQIMYIDVPGPALISGSDNNQ